jgi:geranylgeranyl diphosphate synthase, type I
MQMPDLKTQLSDISKLVEPVIADILSNGLEKPTAAMALHQVSSGGKRIRPALVILTGRMLGAKLPDLLGPAASVEILHNSTLIIDDIIDHSETRRDQPTQWKKHGHSMAECTSLVYTSAAFRGLARSPYVGELAGVYDDALKRVVDGEIKDILFERTGREDEEYVVANRYNIITIDDYLTMIEQKTAVLIEASCKIGAICAGSDKKTVETIGQYGHNIGMAFQIRDDILDIFGDQKEFGKQIGKDIIEKKMGNVVMLLASEQISADDRQYVDSVLGSLEPVSSEQVAKITDIIRTTDAMQSASTMAEDYTAKAVEALGLMPDNQFRQTLQDIAEYLAKREK